MNRGIYTVATGMSASQQWMDVTANNLANSNTTGFKKDGLSFNDQLERIVAGDGGYGGTLGSIGSGAAIKGQYTDNSQGTITPTGNPFDFAIDGSGMFAVNVPQKDGTTAVRYTRDGSFTLDAAGNMLNREGHAVLDTQNQPIVLPTGQLRVDRDGSIHVDGVDTNIRLGIFQGVFSKQGDNKFVSTNATAIDLTENLSPSVKQSCIESANVNPVTEMVAMIQHTRNFEMAQKSVQSQDEEIAKLIQSMSER